jgi:hypothetical protein
MYEYGIAFKEKNLLPGESVEVNFKLYMNSGHDINQLIFNSFRHLISARAM